MIHPWKHFCTITKHRHKVIAHCFRAGIGFQGLFHDLSKYSPAEFIPGAKYYQGTRSPNERERELFGYSPAWLHHKGRNRHHFEYWNDLNPATKMYEPVPMPVRYVKEMFCDRVAASKIYQGTNYTDQHPLAYFTRGNARRKMHADTADLLEAWLRMLAEKGETATFSHIKSIPNQIAYPKKTEE
ncbi:MAG: catalase [Clostridia bacterium]|nr:catalase [Clostridia bacterium]